MSSVAYPPTVAPGSTMRRIEIQKQPRSYGGQRHGNSITASANNPVELPDISSDPPDSLFNGEDFRYTAPRTTAEAAFIHAILDYTRQHYKSLMLREPPESSRLANYMNITRGSQPASGGNTNNTRGIDSADRDNCPTWAQIARVNECNGEAQQEKQGTHNKSR